ncbi:MAG: hypothetical protein E6R04_04200 [Spirochaetes bacterium]|nr:MAG: hypothetical protein E6R04_04200 [Spirochaetota bacterium]
MADGMENQEVSTGEDSAFDSAFDAFSNGDVPKEPDEEIKEGDSAEQNQEDDGGEPGTSESVENKEGSDQETKEEGSDEKQETKVEDGTEEGKKQVQESGANNEELEALKRELAELRKLKEQVPNVAEEKVEQQEEKPTYTAEEIEAIKKYKEEWSEVAAAEALIRRDEYSKVVKYVFDQVQEVIQPMIEYINERSPKDQYRDLKSEVEDYDVVRDKAIEWAQTQPAFLRGAYNDVIQNGSVKEVAEFLNHFKKETGYGSKGTPKVAETKPTIRTVEKVTDPNIQKAANVLKAVKSKQTAATTGADPNDFDSAFDEFAQSRAMK